MQAEPVFSGSMDTAFALGAFCTTWLETLSGDLASRFATKETVWQCGLNIAAVCLHHHSSQEMAGSVRLWGCFGHNCIFQLFQAILYDTPSLGTPLSSQKELE